MFRGVISEDINGGREVLCDGEAFTEDDPRYFMSQEQCGYFEENREGDCFHRYRKDPGDWWTCIHPLHRSLAEDTLIEIRLEGI